MKTWVLIIAIYLTGERGGVSITHVEFGSRSTCEAAGRAMAAEWSRNSLRAYLDQSRWVCVENDRGQPAPSVPQSH